MPVACDTCSTEGAAAVLDGLCLPVRASAMVAATKPLTDAPAATAAFSIASRCSIGTRSEITLVFGVLLLTGAVLFGSGNTKSRENESAGTSGCLRRSGIENSVSVYNSTSSYARRRQ